jgi:uncharacterized protein
MKKILVVLILLLSLSIVQARSADITLLTVGEINNQSVGGTANLKLEIRPGTGRVFIDSFPLTQLDTQISTRFGKQVACNFLDANCDQYDFFYTIRATSALVGGPSAGAATTVLTISVLEDIALNKDVVMTGTINSGGIIGPVSGIEPKILAAKRAGFSKVLIPKWSALESENISEIEGIEVVYVTTLEEAIWHLTNKNYQKPQKELIVPIQYKETMGKISNQLCTRHYEMFPLGFESSNESLNNAELAMERGDFYSAASFCFSANVVAKTNLLLNITEIQKQELFDNLSVEIEAFSNYINSKQLETFSDLEASVIVKERLFEAKSLLEREDALNNLAYIDERFFSAVAWANFFDYESESLELDTAFLNSACNSKIAEVEERLNYLQYIAGTTGRYSEELDNTRKIANSGDFAFCLFRATRIKADINSLLISVMVGENSVAELANDKVNLAYAQLSNARLFSILSYSYLDYANTLKNQSPELAIIFSEYSSEFANLDMYFPSKQKKSYFVFLMDPYFRLGLFGGLFIFVLLLSLVFLLSNYKPGKAKSSPRKKR